MEMTDMDRNDGTTTTMRVGAADCADGGDDCRGEAVDGTGWMDLCDVGGALLCCYGMGFLPAAAELGVAGVHDGGDVVLAMCG